MAAKKATHRRNGEIGGGIGGGNGGSALAQRMAALNQRGVAYQQWAKGKIGGSWRKRRNGGGVAERRHRRRSNKRAALIAGVININLGAFMAAWRGITRRRLASAKS
jgi:hypothetical protein